MATSGGWRILGKVTGLPSGNRDVDVTVAATATAVDHVFTSSFGAGYHAIAVPINATACLIIPPSTNAIALTLKGATGDTGIPISMTQPTLIALDTTATVVGLTTGGVTAAVTFIFM